jgi:catechol 2,3-dioxygenase-like lactoylglutathione lyase family enzyme
MKAYLHSIDHVNIVVKNLDEVAGFFVSLGLQVMDRSRLAGEWISKIVGLQGVDKAEGIVPLSAVREYAPGNKRLVYFKGPEDILLELAQYGDCPANGGTA